MDEFHFYGDRDRGWAWQIPLLILRDTRFLLMSATLGNTAVIEEKLRDFSGRESSHVWSDDRPVPLDFDYRETPLHETVEKLVDEGRAPVYLVNFTQREAAEAAGALTSAHLTNREQRAQLARAIQGFRFDTPYGKEVKRMISHGVGLHHAGLLPKYRLLVEELSQQGLLRVISGTDTLGVGVNIPIRTVLFSKLSKYDGEKVRLLGVREFKQIAGRAGRKGFDDRGSVVCQAPEHVVENKRADAKQARGGRKKSIRKKAPPPGFVGWGRDTFEQLVARPPETLKSKFRVTHGTLVRLLQREPDLVGRRGGYGALVELIARSHEAPLQRRRLRREAATLFRALRRAGIVQVENHQARVADDLQRDFSLHQTLSLYMVEALSALQPEDDAYAQQVLSVVEGVQENPVALLRAQVRKAKGELVAKLKAERVPYEERMERLEKVSHAKPEAEFLAATFRLFAEHHPWVSQEAVRPKSIAREMWEGFESFDGYVIRYGLQRSEGLLLRYLGQVETTLEQTVPEAAKTERVREATAYLRTLVKHVDGSLLEAWERQAGRGPAEAAPVAQAAARRLPLAERPKELRARVRAELHALVRALSRQDFAAAADWVRQDPDDPWDAERFAQALAPFLAEHGQLRFDPSARQPHLTRMESRGPRLWSVQQGLLEPAGTGLWAIEGEVSLPEDEPDPDQPLVRVLDIHD
jgi:hypothetical protein